MKSKIFTMLLMLLPFTHVSAFLDDDDEDLEGFDQFLLTMGTSGYLLWQAIDIAKENNYRYVKILVAEYTVGNQSGGFTCPLQDENNPGKVINFEDESFKLVVSCFDTKPDDTDYIDIEEYKTIIDSFGLDEEDPGFNFDGDYDDEGDWD